MKSFKSKINSHERIRKKTNTFCKNKKKEKIGSLNIWTIK